MISFKPRVQRGSLLLAKGALAGAKRAVLLGWIHMRDARSDQARNPRVHDQFHLIRLDQGASTPIGVVTVSDTDQ